MEHADGSFLDHLKWGYEFSVAHYNQKSPNVLLLHSVMGVGTNFFPMRIDQIPKLRTFISDEEYLQIQAFPSMLRLVFSDTIVPELMRATTPLSELARVDMYRVIDNQPISMSAEDFWTALNFQVVHLIDFLPVANWNETWTISDPYLVLYTKLFNFLKAAGRLEADVGLIPPTEGGDVGPHPELTFGSVLVSIAPSWAKWSLFTSSVKDMSAEIGHSMEYKLVWKSADTCPKVTGETCLFWCDGANADCSNTVCRCKPGLCASNGNCVPADS